jgi:hypothetical protein
VLAVPGVGACQCRVVWRLAWIAGLGLICSRLGPSLQDLCCPGSAFAGQLPVGQFPTQHWLYLSCLLLSVGTLGLLVSLGTRPRICSLYPGGACPEATQDGGGSHKIGHRVPRVFG